MTHLSKWKINSIAVLASLFFLASNCFGQSAVIRGEVGVGTADYRVIQINSAGQVLVTPTSADPCSSNNVVRLNVAINITTATTTQLVALSGASIVYVCGFTVTVSQVVTTPNTFKFVYGTGASCGTGTTNITGLFGDGGVTAAAPIVVSTGFWGSAIKTAAGTALCITTAIGATASFQGVLTYVQA